MTWAPLLLGPSLLRGAFMLDRRLNLTNCVGLSERNRDIPEKVGNGAA